MGYSCSTAADNALTTLMAKQKKDCPGGSQNGWIYKGTKYFYEIGREHADGAITGTIQRTLKDYYGPGKDACQKAGSFRIEPITGKITKFPFTVK